MAVTPSTLRLRFPEVSSTSAYSDPYLQLKIDDAALQVDTRWGKWQDLAQSYLAMHLLYVSEQTKGGLQDASGMLSPSTQETVGAVSHSSGIMSIDQTNPDSIYFSNIYGQEFYRLRKMAFPFNTMVI